eukprot:Pompholyxophrys_punicea_v1_NODE_86_length_3660_cov_55.910402.p1 type:complete len:137 gc:universal NODE_86_length_3660_cov_55.910402:1231-821(-)
MMRNFSLSAFLRRFCCKNGEAGRVVPHVATKYFFPCLVAHPSAIKSAALEVSEERRATKSPLFSYRASCKNFIGKYFVAVFTQPMKCNPQSFGICDRSEPTVCNHQSATPCPTTVASSEVTRQFPLHILSQNLSLP